MAKNEKTSKPVASKAGKLLQRMDAAYDELKEIEHMAMLLNARTNLVLPMVRGILLDTRSIAASTLTQAPDKKRKKP